MPDPFRPVRPGEDVQFSATTWNAMLHAGRLARAGRFDGGDQVREGSRNPSIVRVKNETGADLPRYGVVGLGSPIFTPEQSEDVFLREVTFRGVEPEATHAGRFAVVLEPAPVDRVVRAVVSGVVHCMIDVGNQDDRSADVDPGETGHLKSGSGSAQILWKEGDESSAYYTGMQWAVVRLGGGGSGIAMILTTSAISARSSTTVGTGTADLVALDGSTLEAGDEIDIKNLSAVAGDTGKYGFAANIGGTWFLVSLECD